MRDNVSPLQMPKLATNRLWRIRLVDSMVTPKTTSVLLIRGGESVFDAATRARKTPGFVAFSKMFPEADISEVCYSGEIELQG